MSFLDIIEETAKVIRNKAPNAKPKVGLILGSGLGPLADEVKDAISISYKEVPNFPKSTIPGHEGSIVLGKLGEVPVMCLKGRAHMYESATQEIKVLIRVLKQMGCHSVIITNAAGSLRPEIGPGEVCLVSDHINFMQTNPVVGENDDEFGPRFIPMDKVYDKKLRKRFHATARNIGITLYEGVYMAVLGPCFETSAEIRAFRMLGADLVGMSTVPDVIVARHCGLRVVALSAVTNLAAGLSDEELSHEHTLKYAQFGGEKLRQLIKYFLEENADELST